MLVWRHKIVAVGPAREVLPGFKGLICDHGEGAILPGLVNCHAHLEFSALAGHPAAGALGGMAGGDPGPTGALAPGGVEDGIVQGIKALHRGGTALVGEVSNTGASWPHLEYSPLSYHLFYECLGFNLKKQLNLTESFNFFGRPGIAANRLCLRGGPCPLFRFGRPVPGRQPLEQCLPAADGAPGASPRRNWIFWRKATVFSGTC